MADELPASYFDFIYYCDTCTNPCFAGTGSLPPNQCIRTDLDVTEKSKWVIMTMVELESKVKRL